MSMSLSDVESAPRDPRPNPSIPTKIFSQLRLDDRVVCITGASDGIGYAVAEGMAEAGAHLALTYNSNDAAVHKGQELATEYGITVRAYRCDVSDAAQVQATIKQIEADFGRLDVCVANAGMAISKPILETSLEEYRQQMAVNVDGVFFCAKYAGEIFRRQGSGNLIITSSISARIVNVPVDQPVYNATKAAVTQLGKSLAREWRDFARVNIVSPGFFDTNMGAAPRVRNEAFRMAVLGRQGDVNEIKALYLYLASDASTFVTGTDIVIDGGYTLP